MATLGKTSITELTLVNPLSNDNLANPHITIDGTEVPLGGSISLLAANNAMLFKGTIGTGGTVTALPATHKAGWTYKVITAGTYAGAKCEVGDMIICITNGTSANNAHWTVVQTNVDGMLTGPASATTNTVAVFDGTTGKVIKSSGFTIGKSVPSDAKFTDTDTKVTSVDNHYSPSSSTTATNTAGGSTLSFGGAVITGIQMDAKGHITGAVTSKLPSNPNTDTATTQTGHYSPSITAQTISGGSGQLSHNGTFTVPSLTFDNKGHLVSGGTTTYTLPSDSNTHHTAYLRTASSSTATGNTTDTSNGIYFNLVENNTVRSNTILSGTSNVTVTSPTAGTVVITGPGTGTTSTYGLVKISNGDVATIANENGLAAGMDHSHSDYATGINNLEERLDNLVTEIEDNELVTAGALTYLEGKLDDITTEIENNEYVTAQALTDLDNRVASCESLSGTNGVSITKNPSTGLNSVGLNLVYSGKTSVTMDDTNIITPSAPTYFYPVIQDKNGRIGVYPSALTQVSASTYTSGTAKFPILSHKSTSSTVAIAYKTSNVYVSGATKVCASGGFYQTSDERKKNFINDISVDFEKLRSIPKSYFTWKEGDDKSLQIGTSAQAVQKIYPELVGVDSETGELSLDYALLSVIALKAVDVLYEENQQIKHRLERIEKALSL